MSTKQDINKVLMLWMWLDIGKVYKAINFESIPKAININPILDDDPTNSTSIKKIVSKQTLSLIVPSSDLG